LTWNANAAFCERVDRLWQRFGAVMVQCRAIALFGVFALALAAGCSDGSGPPTAHLAGVVTLGGQPIPAEAESTIIFRTTTANQASPASSRIVNGRFDVPKAPQGPVRVVFSIQLPIGEKAIAPGVAPEMQYQTLVPQKHADGISLEINGDNLDMKLDL
jgi:hypothetical protein